MKTILITAVGLVIALSLSHYRQIGADIEESTHSPVASAMATPKTEDKPTVPVEQKPTTVEEEKKPAPEPAPQPAVVTPAPPVDQPWTVGISLHGVSPESINNALAIYKEMGLSKEGAAYIIGNYIQESPTAFINPCERYGDGGRALGFGQWHPGRRADMPCTVNEQLKWAVSVEMPRDALGNGYRSLSDRLRSNDIGDIVYGIKQWERYGHEGNRFVYGHQIYTAIK